MSLFLDADEVFALTGRTQRPAQIKALNAMGIEHRVRPDGSVAILRAHIEKIFGGGADSGMTSAKLPAPNWGAL